MFADLLVGWSTGTVAHILSLGGISFRYASRDSIELIDLSRGSLKSSKYMKSWMFSGLRLKSGYYG